MNNARRVIDPRAMPDRIKHLPRDPRGYPVPWFVYRDEKTGEADFRVIGPGKVEQAVMMNLCWVCGGPMARNKAFVIGPMCSINRISAEPPSHRSCAMFAAQACPFLTRPRMRRNAKDMSTETREAAGKMVLHNPGVACVWITREYRLMPVDNGILFRLGAPLEVRWLCQGQPATRREVVQAIDKGLPILIDEAKQDGEDALSALLQAIHRMRQYLPGAKDGEPGEAAAKPAQRSSAA